MGGRGDKKQWDECWDASVKFGNVELGGNNGRC